MENTVNSWYNTYRTSTQDNDSITDIDEEEYFRQIDKGKSSSPGKDLTTKFLLRQLNPNAHNFIRKTFNFCLQTKQFPEIWKSGIAITIPKPGLDHSHPKSYRPIILLSVIGKIFESILNQRIINTTNEKIPIYQFGFKPKNSTIHPLTILYNNIQSTHLLHRRTATLFLDINKAFDSVWHQGLLYKLQQIGIKPYILRTIDDYLKNRHIRIKINGTYSSPFTTLQGVPQGSPLSPTLYNLYCHDIYASEANYFDPDQYILQYADDTTLVAHDKTLDKVIHNLQQMYNQTLSWFYKWRLLPNPSKFQLLIPHHRISVRSPYIYTGQNNLKPTQTVKYLGILLDSRLKLTTHYKKTQTEMRKRAKHFRTLTYKDKGISPQNATQIYKSICRPL